MMFNHKKILIISASSALLVIGGLLFILLWKGPDAAYIDQVRIYSSNQTPDLAKAGDTVYLSFEIVGEFARQPEALIAGKSADVKNQTSVNELLSPKLNALKKALAYGNY